MKKYALVVGISQYEDPEITDLQFAARDAEMVGTCLAEMCGFDEVRTLTSGGDREPSHVLAIRIREAEKKQPTTRGAPCSDYH